MKKGWGKTKAIRVIITMTIFWSTIFLPYLQTLMYEFKEEPSILLRWVIGFGSLFVAGIIIVIVFGIILTVGDFVVIKNIKKLLKWINAEETK